MAQDEYQMLELLKFELKFVKDGGYRRSPRTPWRPPFVLEDSPSCPNLGDPARTHPCSECRSTLDGWVLKVGELLVPMVAAMRRELITGTYIQADETPVDVQTREGRESITKRISGNIVAPEGLWCSTSV